MEGSALDCLWGGGGCVCVCLPLCLICVAQEIIKCLRETFLLIIDTVCVCLCVCECGKMERDALRRHVDACSLILLCFV